MKMKMTQINNKLLDGIGKNKIINIILIKMMLIKLLINPIKII